MSKVLKGDTQLKARLKAIAQNTFKPGAKAWADETVKLAESRVGSYHMPYSRGILVPSIRRQSATQKRARVTMSYHGYFVDSGTRGEGPQSRAKRASRQKHGPTYFARQARKPKHRGGYAARPFRSWAAHRALELHPLTDAMIRAWNEAA